MTTRRKIMENEDGEVEEEGIRGGKEEEEEQKKKKINAILKIFFIFLYG